MLSLEQQKKIRRRLHESRLECRLEFKANGSINLTDEFPIPLDEALKTFPEMRFDPIDGQGSVCWRERPDDMRYTYWITLWPDIEADQTTIQIN